MASLPEVTIIDYGMGNVGSVRNAFEALGATAIVSSDKNEIKTATHLVLPGVGAFPDGMKKLTDSGLAEEIRTAALDRGTPLLGICLGMQMLADRGEEGESTKGLGLLHGTVRRFHVDESRYRIPHVGWNDVVTNSTSVLFKEVKRPIFYFVHSYHFVIEDPSIVAGTSEHGETFTAAVEKGTIFGVQFHPEKSQENGLAVLHNFLRVGIT